jgi:hypothetical protein
MTDAVAAPLVVLVGSGTHSAHASPGDALLPPALNATDGRPLADQWWSALKDTGLLPSSSSAVLATDAVGYKAFEFWGFGKGLHVHQIVNSGRSIAPPGFVPSRGSTQPVSRCCGVVTKFLLLDVVFFRVFVAELICSRS